MWASVIRKAWFCRRMAMRAGAQARMNPNRPALYCSTRSRGMLTAHDEGAAGAGASVGEGEARAGAAADVAVAVAGAPEEAAAAPAPEGVASAGLGRDGGACGGASCARIVSTMWDAEGRPRAPEGAGGKCASHALSMIAGTGGATAGAARVTEEAATELLGAKRNPGPGSMDEFGEAA